MKQPDTLTGRIRRFFTDNQDEEMTYELLAEKFDAPIMTVRSIVKELRKEGVVESLHVIRHPSKGIAS
jgi:DNA-binding Lrp family transcriptional regulator